MKSKLIFIILCYIALIALCCMSQEKKQDEEYIEIKYVDFGNERQPDCTPVTIKFNSLSFEPIYTEEFAETAIDEHPYKEIIDSLTDYELYYLYQITCAESANQPIEGQRAVIEVILNRMISDEFPDTIYEVLSQPGQFASWGKRHIVTYDNNQIEALNLVYDEEPILNTEYVFFATYKFSWADNYIQIEDHWFGTFKE